MKTLILIFFWIFQSCAHNAKPRDENLVFARGIYEHRLTLRDLRTKSGSSNSFWGIFKVEDKPNFERSLLVLSPLGNTLFSLKRNERSGSVSSQFPESAPRQMRHLSHILFESLEQSFDLKVSDLQSEKEKQIQGANISSRLGSLRLEVPEGFRNESSTVGKYLKILHKKFEAKIEILKVQETEKP